jgi:large conductance mechanosensitive channel
MLKGFRDFIVRGKVVDLAVAVVMGAAFGAVVASLVGDLLTPFIAAIFGKPDFSRLSFTIHQSTFYYGRFINALLSFLGVSAAVYFAIVKPMRAIEARRDAKPAAAPSQEIVLLSEIRDLLAQRDSVVMQRERTEPGSRAG